MLMLITYITCFAIYLATQQCINFLFSREYFIIYDIKQSARFFWTPGITAIQRRVRNADLTVYNVFSSNMTARPALQHCSMFTLRYPAPFL